MRILVTGGAGFIGSHIVEEYVRRGHEVVVLDDLSSGDRTNVPRNLRFYEVSISDREIPEILRREKIEVVNHHAAQIDVRKSVEDPVFDASINILGTLNLLEASRKAGVKKIIFASSGGVAYGDQKTFPADESHPTAPQSPYGIAKVTIEKYLQYYSWTHKIPYVALRYANVYGPRQSADGEAGVVAIFTQKLLKGETPIIYGDGKQTRDFVFVEDAVHCNVAALAPEVQGVFNVGTGAEMDINTVAREIMRLTQTDLKPQHAPAKAGETRRSSIKPGVLQRIPPTPLVEGLRKTVAWFRSDRERGNADRP